MADIKIKAAFNRADLGNAVVESDLVAEGLSADNPALSAIATAIVAHNPALTIIVDGFVADEALMLKIKNALPA